MSMWVFFGLVPICCCFAFDLTLFYFSAGFFVCQPRVAYLVMYAKRTAGRMGLDSI